MKRDIGATLLLAILLGALVYLAMEQVRVSRQILARTSTMTDPAANELKTSWLTGYDASHNPQYWTVVTTREAGETVTHWIDRHSQACKDAAALHPPYEPPH